MAGGPSILDVPPDCMTERKLVFLRRLGSAVALWTAALWIIFSGNELGFFLMISSLGLIGLWEYYRMLDHHRLPNFKFIGMLCGAMILLGSFYYFSSVGPARSYDFEVAALLTFMLVVFGRQMFQRTRDVSPLETMAYTVFGLFYVPWLFSFVTKIVYLLPRAEGGAVTGHFYVLWLLVVTKFSDMGAYVTGSVFGKHPMVPHISPKKTWEGLVGALLFSVGGGCGLLALIPGICDLGHMPSLVSRRFDLQRGRHARAVRANDGGRAIGRDAVHVLDPQLPFERIRQADDDESEMQ